MCVENRSQLRKLQLCQLHVLEEIDRICEENGLVYYLAGGSALGAVRHGGFIPWDDDLDIAMYRYDYEQFQKIIQSQYSEKYFLQSPQTDPNYPRVIAKIRLNGTVQQEQGLEGTGCHSGICVDVFPIDYVKRSTGPEMWLRGKIVRLCFAYQTVRCGSNNGRHMKAKKAFAWVPALIPASWIDRLMTYVCVKDNQKPRPYSTIFLSGYGWKRQTHRSDTFGSGKMVQFEGRAFRAPADIDAFLRKIYGNYMVPPPPERRISHNLTRINFGPYAAELEREVLSEEMTEWDVCRP